MWLLHQFFGVIFANSFPSKFADLFISNNDKVSIFRRHPQFPKRDFLFNVKVRFLDFHEFSNFQLPSPERFRKCCQFPSDSALSAYLTTKCPLTIHFRHFPRIFVDKKLKTESCIRTFSVSQHFTTITRNLSILSFPKFFKKSKKSWYQHFQHQINPKNQYVEWISQNIRFEFWRACLRLVISSLLLMSGAQQS